MKVIIIRSKLIQSIEVGCFADSPDVRERLFQDIPEEFELTYEMFELLVNRLRIEIDYAIGEFLTSLYFGCHLRCVCRNYFILFGVNHSFHDVKRFYGIISDVSKNYNYRRFYEELIKEFENHFNN